MFFDVELEVYVRKYQVDIKGLQKLLREHKSMSNQDISYELDVPITKVEHWFRKDKYFAIPDAEIWLQLKQLLNIQNDEFDESILTFEAKGGEYDMRNRIHYGNVSETLSSGCGNSLDLLDLKKRLEKKVKVKVGDKIRILDMVDEHKYCGKEGTITNIDSIGQLHGTWGGLAVIPGVDEFEIIG